jgi:hypothetical protein
MSYIMDPNSYTFCGLLEFKETKNGKKIIHKRMGQEPRKMEPSL